MNWDIDGLGGTVRLWRLRAYTLREGYPNFDEEMMN